MREETQICDECGFKEPASSCYGDPCLPDDWGYDDNNRELCPTCTVKFPCTELKPSGPLANFGASFDQYIPAITDSLAQVYKARKLKP